MAINPDPANLVARLEARRTSAKDCLGCGVSTVLTTGGVRRHTDNGSADCPRTA